MALPDSFDIAGTSVSFPIEVRHARMANAVYTVRAERIGNVFGSDPFVLDVGDNGMATVVIGFVDYLDNDLGDYDEVLFSVMARTVDGSHAGSYIWRLPVNQDFTCEAGVRMLGLPKTVEDITIERTASTVTSTLASGGHTVVQQVFPTLVGADPMPMPTPTVCLSVIDGAPYVSESHATGDLLMAFDAEGYGLRLGDHAWADELRAMGLEDGTPDVITVCDNWRCTFAKPTLLS